MKEFKIPGVLWTLLIAIAIVCIETFVAPGYQFYAEAVVVVLMAVAKGFNLDNKQIEELVAVIRNLQKQLPAQEAAFVQSAIEAHQPDKFTTWLVG